MKDKLFSLKTTGGPKQANSLRLALASGGRGMGQHAPWRLFAYLVPFEVQTNFTDVVTRKVIPIFGNRKLRNFTKLH